MGVLKRISRFPNFQEAYGGFGTRSGPPEFSESLWGIELTRIPRRLPSPWGGEWPTPMEYRALTIKV
jgi:hypothetical protein